MGHLATARLSQQQREEIDESAVGGIKLVSAERPDTALKEAQLVAESFRSLLDKIADIVPFPGMEYGALVKNIEQVKEHLLVVMPHKDLIVLWRKMLSEPQSYYIKHQLWVECRAWVTLYDLFGLWRDE